VQQAVALIGESDWALRALMRRALEAADYAVVEGASPLQLEAALRMRPVNIAPRALLVVSASMLEACSQVVADFTRWRAAFGRSAPHVLLTCEFGTFEDSPLPDLGACFFEGILEKPFDFTSLQSIADRCRTSSTDRARDHADS
jgi:hypothetical protein